MYVFPHKETFQWFKSRLIGSWQLFSHKVVTKNLMIVNPNYLRIWRVVSYLWNFPELKFHVDLLSLFRTWKFKDICLTATFPSFDEAIFDRVSNVPCISQFTLFSVQNVRVYNGKSPNTLNRRDQFNDNLQDIASLGCLEANFTPSSMLLGILQ